MDESIRRYGTIVREPGENYLYSNFGYGLLEYAIERTSGKNYEQFMREELFAPLGLTESVAGRPKPSDRVASRYGVGGHREVVPYYDFDHRGASAIYMSAHDLVRFGMFHLDGKLAGQQRPVLKPETIASMVEQAVGTGGGFSPNLRGLDAGGVTSQREWRCARASREQAAAYCRGCSVEQGWSAAVLEHRRRCRYADARRYPYTL